MKISAKIFKKSKWIHKYLGLIVLTFLTWMSITGIILNHPNLISKLSVSSKIVPKSYTPNNWNRSSMKGIIYDKDNDSTLYVYGRQGIHISTDNGESYKPFMNGRYPQSPYPRRTNHVFYEKGLMLSATNTGLFQYDFINKIWKDCPIGRKDEKIVKIIKTKDKLIALSDSHIYTSEINNKLNFKETSLKKDIKEKRIRLIQVFLELHDGSIFGLPGKIIWDIVGLILLFLCYSAFYIWYFPKKSKKLLKRKKERQSPKTINRFKFIFKYHKKLGWYAGILLIIITITGIFLRPPLIATLAGKTISASLYPSSESNNQWEHKINNALYDSLNDKLVIECKDGIWTGTTQEGSLFKKIEIPVRIFAMGATVFRESKSGEWLIGSFGGLSSYNLQTGETKAILLKGVSKSSGRPARTMVTACITVPDSSMYILGHTKGICNLNGEKLNDVLHMPKYISEEFRLPLWNYFFEIHNARIFRSFIGKYYILVIPLLGLLTLLVMLSGIIDYLYRRRK